MKIAILDMGTRNTAIIVEEIPNRSIKVFRDGYSKLAKKCKIIEGRPHHPSVVDMLKEYTRSGTTLLLELYDPNTGNKEGLTNRTRQNLHRWLNTYKSLLLRCDYIAIEEQFYSPQTGTINKPALLLAESAYSWFLINEMDVQYTPSKLKTAILGCPKESLMIDKETGLRVLKKWEKSDRKKWSQQVAIEIYKTRGDSKMVEYIKSRKGDDISDCLLMSIAFVVKEFVMD